MKTKRKWLMLALSGLTLLTGCQKEPQGDALLLSTEGFWCINEGKMAVSGNNLRWEDGDEVRVNGRNYDVVAYEDHAQIDISGGIHAPFRAIYPANLNRTATLDADVVHLNFPDAYTYLIIAGGYNHGLQDVEVPMAAKSTSGNRLFFQHLTGAITVQIKNDFGIDITLDSIVIASNMYQLSGEKDITLSSEITVSPHSWMGITDAQKRVVMRFNGYRTLTVPVGATKEVQIPVLPVGSGNKFTITIAAHNSQDTEMQYTLIRTQSSGGALARNQLGYAPVKFGGVFSIGASRKVHFSPGNLQYTPNNMASHYTADGIASGAWRFAPHQYDYVGTGNNNITQASYTGWIDLFGWGTSGWSSGANATHPTSTSTTDADYYPGGSYTNSLTNLYAYADWAYYNAIRNGGNVARRWRTLTSDEWQYLFNTRTNASQLYGLGKIDNQYYGLIILPDDWETPDGLTFTSGYNGWSNMYSLDEWTQMEACGAIFLPRAGVRIGTSTYLDGTSYWSTTYYDNTRARRVNIMNGYFVPNGCDNRQVGYSVRPVRSI